VDPTFASLNGTDPVAYVLSANVARRNLTVGQRAMAVAILNNFSGKNFQDGKEVAALSAGVSPSRLSYAIAVVDHAPDLADQVMAGTMSLAGT